jgi:hypothetical protein
MLYLVAIVLGVLLGIVFKGKLSNLLNIRLEKVWIVILVCSPDFAACINTKRFWDIIRIWFNNTLHSLWPIAGRILV